MATSTRPAVERVHPPRALILPLNRLFRRLLSSPRSARGIGKHLLLLHMTGRRSGRALTVPVGYRQGGDGRLLLVTDSVWRLNLRGRPEVEVTLLGRRRPATAELVEDPEAVARVYGDLIREVGYKNAGRRLGIRITVDREPTHEELVQAAKRHGMSLVYLRVLDA